MSSLTAESASFRIVSGAFSPSPDQFDLEAAARKPAGAFTTFLIRREASRRCVFDFNRHISRLVANARALGVPRRTLEENTEEHLTRLLPKLLAEHSFPAGKEGDLRVRLVLDREGLELYVDRYRPAWPKDGVALISIHATRSAPEIKSTHADVSRLARREAERVGAHEALLVDSDGTVREGAWSNFFWLDRRGHWHTPPQVLPGITRARLLSLIPCVVDNSNIEQLKAEAAAAVVTQATSLASPVFRIDDTVLPCAVTRTEGLLRALEAASFESALIL